MYVYAHIVGILEEIPIFNIPCFCKPFQFRLHTTINSPLVITEVKPAPFL